MLFIFHDIIFNSPEHLSYLLRIVKERDDLFYELVNELDAWFSYLAIDNVKEAITHIQPVEEQQRVYSLFFND